MGAGHGLSKVRDLDLSLDMDFLISVQSEFLLTNSKGLLIRLKSLESII